MGQSPSSKDTRDSEFVLRGASLTRQVELPTRAIAETIVTDSLPRPGATKSRWPSRKVLLLLLVIPIPILIIAGVAYLARGLFRLGQETADDSSSSTDRPPELRPNGPAISPPAGKSPEDQFALLDKNANHSLDPDELAMHITHRANTDAGDELTPEEYRQAWQEQGEKLFAKPEREGYGPRFQRPEGKDK